MNVPYDYRSSYRVRDGVPDDFRTTTRNDGGIGTSG